jgi:hypothetical protein
LPRSRGRPDRGGRREPGQGEARRIQLDLKKTTMTIATVALAELAKTGADVDVLRQVVQFMAQRLMQRDVEGCFGASYDEWTAERLNSGNGYRDRTWDTRAGSVELKIPKLRQPRNLNAAGACPMPAPGAASACWTRCAGWRSRNTTRAQAREFHNAVLGKEVAYGHERGCGRTVREHRWTE